MSDELQNCASCAEAARERDEARAERDKESRVRTLAVDHYHLVNEAMLQAHERVDRIAEAIGCPVHNRDGDDIDREVVVEAARTLVRERDEARAEVEQLREQIRIAKMVEARLQAEVKRLRDVLARIEALVSYEPDDEDDLVEAVQAMRRERDEARAEVARLRHHASGMEDELRYGEEVCATIVDERDEALSQVKAWQAEELARRTERDDARAEVERLRKHFEAASPEHNLPALLDLYDARRTTAEDERDEARAEVERLRGALTAVVPQQRANQSCVEGREAVDADWLLENWSTLRDEEEILCTVGGVRRWLGVVLCDALTRPTDAAASPE